MLGDVAMMHPGRKLLWDVAPDNDLIGACTIKITRRMIDEGKVDLCFDQVESLRLEIE